MATRQQKGSEVLYVLIPCLNEEETIEPTVSDVLEVAPRLPVDLRILLIDDCSTDGTRAKMEALARRHPQITVQANAQNLGIGRSVINAYQQIPAGSWVTGIPGDYEIAFSSIENFLPLRHDHDIILGYLRNTVVRTPLRRAASRAFHLAAGLTYGYPWRYLNGLKLYRVDAFAGLEVCAQGYGFVAEMLAKALLRNPELSIGEAPYILRGRARGGSKAVRPTSVLRAMREMVVGARSVAAYRERIIRERI